MARLTWKPLKFLLLKMAGKLSTAVALFTVPKFQVYSAEIWKAKIFMPRPTAAPYSKRLMLSQEKFSLSPSLPVSLPFMSLEMA